MHTAALPVIRETASAMKPADSSWCGRNNVPAALLGEMEQVNEVRIGDAEERVDALGLEEIQNAFVDLN